MDARHQAVMAELERVGWRSTTIGSPFIGTTCVIDNRFVASAMAIEDLTIIEVYDVDLDDPMAPGLVTRPLDPVVKTAHHPGFQRTVSATVVDLRNLALDEVGPAVFQGLSATTISHVRSRWPSSQDTQMD
jgi:hypothetical protein